MTKEVWFWIFYAGGLFVGLWQWYTPGQPYPWPRAGWVFLIFVLLLILGLTIFGSPVK